MFHVCFIYCLISACSGKEDSYPPLYYYLKVEFVTSSDEDRLSDIPHLDEEVGPDMYEIKNSLYAFQVVQTGKPKEALLLSPLYIQTTPEANDLAPYYGCSQTSNGRAPIGCVATAVAQVMKHWEYPSMVQIIIAITIW